MKTRTIVVCVLAAAVLAAVVAPSGGKADEKTQDESYFVPADQAAAPAVAWVCEVPVGPGVNGDLLGLVAGPGGDAYVAYAPKSRVTKFGRNGQVLWDKTLVSGQGVWSSLVSGPRGEPFVVQTDVQSAGGGVLSRLLPDGTLARRVSITDGALAGSLPAVTANGGWVVEEAAKGKDALGGPNYLAEYSPSGKREWSVQLRNATDGADATKPENYISEFTSARGSFSQPQLDAQGNSYLLSTSVSLARSLVSLTELVKVGPDGKVVWTAPLSLESAGGIVISRTDSAGETYIVGQRAGQGYYIAKFDTGGKQMWVRWQTGQGKLLDTIQAAVDDSGSVYVAGSRKQATTFVAKHDPAGRLLWRRELQDLSRTTGLAVSGGSAYVLGLGGSAGRKPYLLRLAPVGS